MQQDRLIYLLERLKTSQLTQEEFDEFMLIAGNTEDGERIKENWMQDIENSSPGHYDKDYWTGVFKNMMEKQIIIPVRRMSVWLRVAAAVIILFGLSIGAFLLISKNKDTPAIGQQSLPAQNDIKPGANGAILTLADGKQLILDSANNGNLAQQQNVRIVKEGNQVRYEFESLSGLVASYNTMATPKGRQYSLVLADGSKVWLNAASSIRFPTAFPGNERKVEVTGEVYFEIAKDAHKPFHVVVDGMDVQVFGTHFNVNAYSNEQDKKVTLLEGSVKVSNAGKNVTLIPGQQARSHHQNGVLEIVKDIDVDEVIAWKNGRFEFNETDLRTIMRQIERWYDVEVVYEGNIQQREFTGKVSRNVNVSQVLKILELNNIHFRIEGKKIIVIP